MLFDLVKNEKERVLKQSYASMPDDFSSRDTYETETPEVNVQYKWLDDYGWI